MGGPTEIAATGRTTPWYHEMLTDSCRFRGVAGLGWMFDTYDTFVLSLTIPALVLTFGLSNAQAGAIGSISAAGLIVGLGCSLIPRV